MTDPATIARLDQAVIDAGQELIRAQLDSPRDPERLEQARLAYLAALARRWPNA